uniref:Uncharacterized protein n=1 Tax=Oryza meridionalis TaxID=40149 RepID=A0A0E0DDI6_9ORYZ
MNEKKDVDAHQGCSRMTAPLLSPTMPVGSGHGGDRRGGRHWLRQSSTSTRRRSAMEMAALWSGGRHMIQPYGRSTRWDNGAPLDGIAPAGGEAHRGESEEGRGLRAIERARRGEATVAVSWCARKRTGGGCAACGSGGGESPQAIRSAAGRHGGEARE